MRMTQEQLDQVLARNARLTRQRKPRSSVDVSHETAWPVPPKRQKYGNKKTQTLDGIVHDSGKEARRWDALQLRARSGEISELRRQVPFALVVSGLHVCSYVADFVYRDGAALVVEDVKSEVTRKLAAWRIKVKLMAACHGLQVTEV